MFHKLQKITMSRKIIYRLQLTSASLSVLSSSFIALGVQRSDGGLTSPYRRIIFGISIFDMMQSLSIMLGPLAVPSSTPLAKWAMGNYDTCLVDGAFLCFAACCTPMYMCLLCLYTVVKIKQPDMTDKMFTRKIEKAMHFFIFSLGSGIMVSALATKAINPTSLGSVCTFGPPRPTGCAQRPDIFGECEKVSGYVTFLIFIFKIGLPFLCLVGITACMSIICWHVIQTTRFPGLTRGQLPALPPAPSSGLSSSLSIGITENQGYSIASNNLPLEGQEQETPAQAFSDATTSSSAALENPIVSNQGRLQQGLNRGNAFDLGRLYRREIVLQASCFVLAFVMTFIFKWIAQGIILWGKTETVSIFLNYSSHFFYPLGGFFNMLAYSRPKVRNLRIRNPGYSWLRAFYLVIKTGADLPRQNAGFNENHAPDTSTRSIAFGVPSLVSSDDSIKSSVGAQYHNSQPFNADNAPFIATASRGPHIACSNLGKSDLGENWATNKGEVVVEGENHDKDFQVVDQHVAANVEEEDLQNMIEELLPTTVKNGSSPPDKVRIAIEGALAEALERAADYQEDIE